MKFILQLILVLGISQITFSQKTLKGNITDYNTNEPLINSTIYVVEFNKGTSTNENGDYLISGIGKGIYKVQITHLGYQSQIHEIEITNNTNEFQLNIALKQKSIQINEVVVSNAYINSQDKSTYKIDVVKKEEMQKIGAFTIMDLINKVSGVDAITSGPLVSRPVIRGLSGNRILTVIDGTRFETQQWDDEHGIGVNELGLNQVEIIKGPSSLLYGPEAMGGVVNFVKTKPADVGTIKGNALASMYTNNLGWRANANIDGAKEKYNWGISTLGKLYSDYFINNQSFRIPNTRLLEYGAKGYLGINRKWGSTNISYVYNQAFYGILDGKDIIKDTNGNIINTDIEKEKYPFEIEAPFHTVVDNRITSNTTLLSGKSKFDVILGYQNNHRSENEEITGVKKGYRYVDMSLQSTTYNIKWYMPTLGRFSTIIGSQGMHQTNKNISGAQTVLIPNATINDFGLFGVSKYELEKFNFSLGIRYDSRNLNTHETTGYNYSIPEISKNYNNLSTSVGISYCIEKDLTLRTSFATGYRSPNLNELTANGFKLESQRFEVGNANFTKENNNQFDFNVTYLNENITLESSFYFNRINNYIYIAPTGNQVPSNIDPTNNVTEYKFYQSNAEITGGEARIDIHPKSLKRIHFETKFSTLVGKRTDNNSYLPMMPATKITNTFFININPIGKFKDNSINIGTISALKQDQVAENELETPSYTIINLGFGTKFKQTEFTLTANNILDKKYYNNMSRFRSFEIYESGLNLALSVKIPLDLK
ncbi:TonB-dependent receptor [Flavobacterium jejuense]|uniref:TonB-dependent receptor n=1 Tax=Flavobacterium jejuense TaxID=1544455 RepID=A0ABX0IR09_9FLAO|nr:TonB-dependent receptor [Flavobacterium jejuense]NHN25302.1 TonB-dependent receptor [Flavobacterium jejuense]